jgi:phage terminase large subunit-like protein
VTLGDDAADFAAAFGLVLDPWQRTVLRDWMGVQRSGIYLCKTCGLSVPRQNGKNAIIEARELFGMVLLGEAFLHTAHEVKTARKAFRRLKHFFGEQANDPNAKFPELNALVVEVRSTNGQEAIYLSNGGQVEFVARSKGSGRGFTVDVLVLDEAQHLTEEELEAIRPAISAAPKGNAQVIYTGTPPGPKVSGEVFKRIRQSCLVRRAKRRCWHEWSADPESVDPDSKRCLHQANPSLGMSRPGALQMDVIRGEREELSLEGFLRERLGMWDEGHAKDGVISLLAWNECLSPDLEIDGKPTLALDVSPMLTFSGIVAAGPVPDGRVGVEVTSDGESLIDYREGTEWAVELLTSHAAEVWIAAGSAAETLAKRLTDGGCTVQVMPRADYAQACVAFAAGVASKRWAHRGQIELDKAVTAGAKRVVGDEGLWTWGRVRSTSDITLLVAATLAAAASQRATYSPMANIL